jgi:hypothetical protein
MLAVRKILNEIVLWEERKDRWAFKTCVVLLKQVIGLWAGKSIYVESICRVRTLSLTGKLLVKVVDEFLVQWPELLRNYPFASLKFVGRLS